MKKLDLKYRLTYDEAYETFYALASRRSRKTTLIICAIIAVIAAVLLVLYGMDSRKVHYLFLAGCSIILLFYILYKPVLSARKGASSVAKAAGEYHVTVYDNGTIDLPGEKGIDIHGDKYSRSVETDTVFAIRPDSQHTICIPQRILKDKDRDLLRSILN